MTQTMQTDERIAEIRERAKEKIAWQHGERGSEDYDTATLLSIIAARDAEIARLREIEAEYVHMVGLP